MAWPNIANQRDAIRTATDSCLPPAYSPGDEDDDSGHYEYSYNNDWNDDGQVLTRICCTCIKQADITLHFQTSAAP